MKHHHNSSFVTVTRVRHSPRQVLQAGRRRAADRAVRVGRDITETPALPASREEPTCGVPNPPRPPTWGSELDLTIPGSDPGALACSRHVVVLAVREFRTRCPWPTPQGVAAFGRVGPPAAGAAGVARRPCHGSERAVRVRRRRSYCGGGTQRGPGATAAAGIPRLAPVQSGTESESPPAGASDRLVRAGPRRRDATAALLSCLFGTGIGGRRSRPSSY